MKETVQQRKNQPQIKKCQRLKTTVMSNPWARKAVIVYNLFAAEKS